MSAEWGLLLLSAAVVLPGVLTSRRDHSGAGRPCQKKSHDVCCGSQAHCRRDAQTLGGRKEVRQKAVVKGRLENRANKDVLPQAGTVQPVFPSLDGNSSGELVHAFNPRTGLGVHNK